MCIRDRLAAGESIMISQYPKYDEALSFKTQEGYMNSVMNIIRNVRNQRAEMNVPPSKKAKLIVRTDRKDVISSSAVSYTHLSRLKHERACASARYGAGIHALSLRLGLHLLLIRGYLQQQSSRIYILQRPS